MIIKRTKDFLSVITMIVILSGCSENFDGVDYKPEIYDNNKYEEVYDKVPMLISMNNPYFISITRGLGAITTERNWVKNELTYYVYSFLTNNYAYKGEIDYTQTYSPFTEENPDTPIQCLMDDPKTGRGVAHTLLDNEMLDQNDKDITYYYSQSHQDYKYNIFAYAIDDAKIIGDLIRNKDNIQLDIEIDGTQDVITAVARPTEEQINTIDPEEDKWLFSNLLNGELVYSTTTGHRGIFPILNAKHQMSLFTFNIVGEDAMSDRIFVEEIYVMANKQWRLTVAANDTTKLGLTLPEGKKEKLEKMVLKEMTEEGNPSSIRPIDGNTYNVGKDETIENIGMGLLLPPQDKYDIYVRCRYPSLDSEGREINRYYTARYTLSHRVLGEDGLFKTVPFEAGAEYKVTMHIYGYQPIQLSIGGFAWSEPIEIILDEDDITNFE